MKIRFVLLFTLLGLSVWWIAPTQAQDEALMTVSYNNVSIRYDPLVWGAVYPHLEAAVPPDPNNPMPAGAVTPAYTALTFFQPSAQGVNLETEPTLRVYNTPDIQALGDPYYASTLDALRQLVSQPGNVAGMAGINADGQTSLPYLPALESTQVMHFQAQFIQTRSLSGLRYFTYYSQSVDPITEGQVWYTFQGFAADGAAYVAFTVPVLTGLLPTSIPDNLDYNAFSADYNNFLQTTFDTLNNADATRFAPSVATLDRFVNNIAVRH